MDTLAEIHTIDAAAVGLADLGRPEGFLERQVKRWQKQLAATRTREVPDLDELARLLLASLPRQQTGSLVHGDYRLDNVLVDDATKVSAVLDWEMGTLGDPLTDVASACVWWDGLAGLDCPVAAMPGDVAGFMPSGELLERYAARTSTDLGKFAWYRAFAYFKIAAIFEGINTRHLRAETVGDGFGTLGGLVPELAKRGASSLKGWPWE
jgi:aminoglycoside phosphotransferase (APT) family kinase protein